MVSKLLPKALGCFLLIALPFQLLAGEMFLSGVYKGVNLYIQNPVHQGKEFCIKSVTVNGKSMPIPKATAFELKLSFLAKGTPVNIKIVHHDDCKPVVLNPNSIKDKARFRFNNVTVTDAKIAWNTSGETEYGSFIVLKYEHNEWTEEYMMKAKGSARQNVYTYQAHHHTGENRYQLKYIPAQGKSSLSDEFKFVAEMERVTFYPKRVSKVLTFSREVKYAIRDVHGKVIKKGIAEKVDCSDLKSGNYYLSYDNNTDRFLKK